MKKLMYHLWYAIGLIIVGLLAIAGLVYSAITIPTSESVSDNILFIICFAGFLFFTVFQIYSVIRTTKKEGVFIKNLLYGREDIFSKGTIAAVNIFLALGIFFIIYGILLFIGLDIPFNSFPKQLDILLVNVGLSLIINAIFIDTYPLVKEFDKDIKK